MVDFNIGVDYLDSWVTQDINGSRVGIRAYGARTLHIVAGNGPVLTIRRSLALLGVNGVRQAASALRAWPGPRCSRSGSPAS